jgi:hypothetical protein
MRTIKHRTKRLKARIRKGLYDRRPSREYLLNGNNKNENQNSKRLIIEMWDNYLTFTGLGI